MKISDWPRQQHIHPRTAQRWFEGGNLPVPACRLPSGTILVEETSPQAGKVALYARVSSHDQRPDLERQLGRPVEWAAGHDLAVDMTEVLTSLGARLYGRRSARTRAHRALRCAE
ncbi:Resolvase domain protein, partial [mine drainage metagenome]